MKTFVEDKHLEERKESQRENPINLELQSPGLNESIDLSEEEAKQVKRHSVSSILKRKSTKK